MNQHQHLIQTLQQFHSVEWINQFFNLVKKLFSEHGISSDDERVAFVLGKTGSITLNFGGRNLLQPINGERIACAVQPEFNEEDHGGEFVYPYKHKNGEVEAKLVRFTLSTGTDLPYSIQAQLFEVVLNQLKSSQRSRFRKLHNPLLYDFTMELAVRNEILGELKIAAV